MKNLIILLFTLLGTSLVAQDQKGPVGLDIRTNTICGMCKSTIEKELIYEKGVKSVNVDLEASVIHVDYDAKKTDPAKLRTAVTKLGYAADDLLPEAKARENLPECCKKEGCGMPAEKH